MSIYGYHRASTAKQHLDRGDIEIREYCREHKLPLTNIYMEKRTGRNFDRPRYTVLIEDVLRAGDTLIITEVDRLGRNKKEILKELQHLKDMEVRVMVLELPTTLVDLSQMENGLAKLMMETINNLMLEMYASFAEAEMQKKEKRQREGIEAKKRRGEWDDYGRPAVMGAEAFAKAYERVLRQEVTPTVLMRELGMASTTFYRYRKKYLKKQNKIPERQN
ncbi:DNA recombinase [Lachnospiraceae bacterium]|uniref:recombinase family protein n=1 Tax=Extibacter sp. GGCC_0201 TaxID=2731209 RepID=UPI001AA0F6DC|nr:recombinase family protein [Extibacter sp. GGCC_0201]MBO1720700.1 recombinase family protein [Extibacter sp. GGCC_0201]BDF35875.1 DNA recombinase [Lachnospiraceae bacterium]BDF39876.1 DNA recombinase [Lachnospiraceae bacterium]